MSDILYASAKSFDEATKYNYILCVARNQKQFVINLSCLEDEFTHIMGLDHLQDIKIFSSHNVQIKSSAFQRILSQEISLLDVSKSKHYNSYFPNTYNSITKSEYTLIERISILQDIERILDKVYTGKLYKWNSAKAFIKLPNGKTRRTNISGDYMLAIPSERNPEEKIYLFLYKDTTAREKGDMREQLYLFSAFADCLDLSRGQERPYTILQETKENIKTKEKEILYIHPSYKKELEQNTTQSKPQQNDNIKQIKFDSPAPQNVVHSSSGAATAVMPKPEPFKNFFEKIKSSIKNFFRLQDKPTEQPSLPLNTVSKTDNITDKTQNDTDIKVVSENDFSKELKLLNEARSALANNDIQKNEYTKALIFYIKSLDSEEKTEEAIKNLESLSSELPPNQKNFIKNEIYNVRHYLIEKYRPNERSWLETLRNAKTADKSEMSKEQGISEKENHISKNDCIR